LACGACAPPAPSSRTHTRKASNAAQGLVSWIVLKQAVLRSDMLRTRYGIERRRLALAGDSIAARRPLQDVTVNQARAV
jgi:hypothetical protein